MFKTHKFVCSFNNVANTFFIFLECYNMPAE